MNPFKRNTIQYQSMILILFLAIVVLIFKNNYQKYVMLKTFINTSQQLYLMKYIKYLCLDHIKIKRRITSYQYWYLYYLQDLRLGRQTIMYGFDQQKKVLFE